MRKVECPLFPEVYKRDIDRTLLRRNLTLSVEQRFANSKSCNAWRRHCVGPVSMPADDGFCLSPSAFFPLLKRRVSFCRVTDRLLLKTPRWDH
jgi:hypothetical protein